MSRFRTRAVVIAVTAMTLGILCRLECRILDRGDAADAMPVVSGVEKAASARSGQVPSTAGLRGMVDPELTDRRLNRPSFDLHLKTVCACSQEFALKLRDGATILAERRLSAGQSTWSVPHSGTFEIDSTATGWIDQTVAIQVESEDGTATVAMVTMTPRLLVRGQVIDAASLLPIPSISVSLESRFEEANGVVGLVNHDAAAISTENGWYCAIETKEPRTQSIRVHVAADGYEPASSEWMPALGGRTDIPVLQLRRTTTTWVDVRGRVYMPDGANAVGALVEALPGDSETIFRSPRRWEGAFESVGVQQSEAEQARTRTTTNNDGEFRVAVRSDMSWRLSAWTEGLPSSKGDSFWVASSLVDLHQDIVLCRGTRMRGVVYLTGEALTDPKLREVTAAKEDVEVRRPVRYVPGTFEAEFELGELASGTYVVSLLGARPGDSSENSVIVPVMKQQVSLSGPNACDVVFDLRGALDGPQIRGKMVLADDLQPEFSIIYVYREDNLDQPARTGWPTRDGSFVIHGLTVGAHVALILAANDTGSKLLIHALRVELRGDHDIPIVVAGPWSTIHGSIDWVAGSTRRRTILKVYGLQAQTPVDRLLANGWAVATTELGGFDIIGLPPGSYRIVTADSAYQATVDIGAVEHSTSATLTAVK